MGFTIGDDKMQRDCLRELKVDDFGIESFSFYSYTISHDAIKIIICERNTLHLQKNSI